MTLGLYQNIVKQKMLSVSLILGELGGLLGASLGASFLTFIELLDFLYKRIARRLEMKKRSKVDVQSKYTEGSADS